MVKELTILHAIIPFLSKPKEALYLTALSKELHEPHPTLRLWLKKLEEEGIMKKSIKGRLTLFALNYDQELLLDYLLIAEKMHLLKRAHEELLLKEIVSFLQKKLPENTKAILFGSSVFSLKNASDIDILITGHVDVKEIQNFSKKINKQIHVISLKSLQDVSSSLKIEIVKKHLIIKGSEDVLRWLLW